MPNPFEPKNVTDTIVTAMNRRYAALIAQGMSPEKALSRVPYELENALNRIMEGYVEPVVVSIPDEKDTFNEDFVFAWQAMQP